MQVDGQFGALPELDGQRWMHLRSCSTKDSSNRCLLLAYDSVTRLLAPADPALPGVVQAAWKRSGNGSSALGVFGREVTGAVVLSAVAGYVDTASFMALFGLFTAHITGDLVAIGTSLTEQLRFGAGTRLVMIPIFMVSVAVTTLYARALNRQGQGALAPMLGLLTFALGIFAITGATLRPLANEPDAWAVAIIGGAGVVAMGIQNTLMRNVLSSYSPTTLMTGNLTQCTIDLVEMALPDTANDTQGRLLARGAAGNRLKKFGLPLLGFVFGACLGALFTHSIGLASICLPTVAVGLLALLAGSSASKQRPEALRSRLSLPCRGLARLVPCTCSRTICLESKQTVLQIAPARKIPLRPAPARSGTYPQLAVGHAWGCSDDSADVVECDSLGAGPVSSR